MPTIRAEDRDFWQNQANRKALDFPHVGRNVTIVGGRKHKGKSGKVVRHQRDAYSTAFRYGNDASHHLRDMAGRDGFVCLVATSTGNVWVKATYLLCEGRTHTPEQKYEMWCARVAGQTLTQAEQTAIWREIDQEDQETL